MAIRLRLVNKSSNRWEALCAAEHTACEDDVYLDDGQHDALTEKFLAAWTSGGLISTSEAQNR